MSGNHPSNVYAAPEDDSFSDPNGYIPASRKTLEELRNDTTQTCADIIIGVEENFISKTDFGNFQQDLDNKITTVFSTNNEIMATLEKMKGAMVSLNHRIAALKQGNNHASSSSNNDDNASTTTKYDADHDVIMRTRFSYPINQIPEPGFFSGDVKETELFCELCSASFNSYPNNLLPEETKINFVRSRLRDSARNWFLTKYHNDIFPTTMNEVLEGLKNAFPNVTGPKLAQIQLLDLKQNYGKINEYIEKFRNYSNLVELDERSLALIFFNGLHPKYKEEIKKLDRLPTSMEDIITRCIIFESNLQVNNKIKNCSSSNNKKYSNKNFKNKNNNYNNNYKNNYNKINYNKNNNYNSYNDSPIKSKKLSSKN